MTELFRLGAINKRTGKYTSPTQAHKPDGFMCIDCGNDVIIRKGEIRVHHFAHCKEDMKCDFYNKPTETQIHRSAQLLLQYVLEQKIPLTIYDKCVKCDKTGTYNIHEVSEHSSIVIEYRFEYNGLKILYGL